MLANLGGSNGRVGQHFIEVIKNGYPGAVLGP
jgi:hypothetical protein